MAVPVIGDIQELHCDSNTKTVKQELWNTIFSGYPLLLGLYKGDCFKTMYKHLIARLHYLMQHFNQSGGTVCSIFHFSL